MTSSAPLTAADVLLLVEDDPGDVLLTSEAFAQHHLGVQLHVVSDGEEATRFLRRTGDFASAPRPALVLLDLNLPRRSGLEVLADLKADPDLRTIPVVVLTTSQAPQDIQCSYELHTNAYVVKPVGFQQFVDAIKQTGMFWAVINEPPPVGPAD